MAKKFFKKALSVGLSLAMCAGMVAPAFAATFEDLQNAIDGTMDQPVAAEPDPADPPEVSTEPPAEGSLIEGTDNHYGYAWSRNEETQTWQHGIEAWNETVTDDDGKETTTRNVQLNEDVTYAGGGDKTTITVDDDAAIDLNGKTIDGGYKAGESDGSKHSVITVTDGADLTIKDSTAVWNTETDAEGNEIKTYESGQITGGNAVGPYHEGKAGGGVYVENGNLTLESGAITENNAADNGGGVYVSGKGTFTMNDGLISENIGGNMGGGVYVNTITSVQNGNQAQFIMNDGEISNNSAIAGGGIGAYSNIGHDNNDGYISVDISGGNITGNHATVSHGGGLFIQHDTVSIKNANISKNDAAIDAGGIYIYSSKVDINNTTITENTTNGGKGGGMSVHVGANVTVDETSKIFNNNAGSYSDDIYKQAGTTLKLPSAALMNVVGKDGKPITGWYWDNIYGWGNEDGNSPYSGQDKRATSGTYTGQLYLKAAHDQYFNVEYTDGADGTLFETQQYEVENKNPIPVFNGDIPERPGFTFAGWTVDGESFDPTTGTVTGTLTLVANWVQDPVIVDPGRGDTDVTINDPAIPLASGPITRAQFVDYLWRHEGEPAPVADSGLFEDVTEENEYSPAMAWAKSIGIIEGYEDGTFEPDELVTVSAVRDILTRFAAYADMTMPEMTTLTGAEDEAVLNCDEVLAEFFGEEYAPAEDSDIEIAA